MHRTVNTSIGRADLALLLAQDAGEEGRTAAGNLLGYEAEGAEPSEAEAPPRLDPVGDEPMPVRGKATVNFSLKVGEPKSPLGFWRIVSAEYFDVSNVEMPAWRKNAEPLTKARRRAAQGADTPERPFPYLTPWPRIWPLLKKMLSDASADGPVDVDRLARDLADLKPIRRVPRKRVKRWARVIHLLKDRSEPMTPFLLDMDMLAENLARVCGRHRLKTVVLPMGMEGQGSGAGSARPLPYTGAPGAAVLAFSDLGASEGREHLSERVRQIGERAARTGGRACVLLPFPKGRWPSDVTEHWQAVPWDLGVRPAVARRRNPAVEDGETPSSEGNASAENPFLCLCAPLVRMEPDLLRYVRTLLPYADADAGMESDIYMGRLDPQSAREHFGLLPIEIQRAFALLVEWYHGRFPEIAAEELSAVRALSGAVAEFVTSNTSADAVNAQLVATADEARTVPLDYTPGEIVGYLRRRAERAPDVSYENPRDAALWVLSHLDDDGRLAADEVPRDLPWQDIRWIFRGAPFSAFIFEQLGEALSSVTVEMETSAFGVHEPRGSVLGTLSAGADGVIVSPVDGTPGSRIQWRRGAALPGLLTCTHSGACYHVESPEMKLRLQQISKPDWAQEMGRDSRGLYVVLSEGGRYYWLPPGRYRLTGFAEFEDGSGYGGGIPDTGDLEALRQGCWLLEKIYDWYLSARTLPGEYWKEEAIHEDEYGLYQDVTIRGIPQRFRWIPPGTFLMGSPENEPERKDDERQHEVELTRGFWLADTACTQQLWQAVMGRNPSEFKGDNLPVEQVSWEDCHSFFEKANRSVPGLNLRFPSEAEWEYACRAGTTTPFWFGNNITTDQVNHNGNHPYNDGPKGEYREKTVPVKELPANDWGLHQMHGNVFEWCGDRYGEYLPGLSVDPHGPEQGEARVLRGGSWVNDGRWCRSASRGGFPPGYRNVNIGFRLSRGLVEPSGAEPRGAAEAEVKRSGTGDAPRKGGEGSNLSGGKSRKR